MGRGGGGGGAYPIQVNMRISNGFCVNKENWRENYNELRKRAGTRARRKPELIPTLARRELFHRLKSSCYFVQFQSRFESTILLISFQLEVDVAGPGRNVVFLCFFFLAMFYCRPPP
jgi:hypothetical protein